MAQILDEIIKKTREDLEKRKVEYPVEWLGRSLAFNPVSYTHLTLPTICSV